MGRPSPCQNHFPQFARNSDEENEALAALAGMGIMVLVVVGALVLAVSIFYFLTLHQTMNSVDETRRPLAGGLIWLALAPGLGLIWYMVYILLLSSALKRSWRSGSCRATALSASAWRW